MCDVRNEDKNGRRKNTNDAFENKTMAIHAFMQLSHKHVQTHDRCTHTHIKSVKGVVNKQT